MLLILFALAWYIGGGLFLYQTLNWKRAYAIMVSVGAIVLDATVTVLSGQPGLGLFIALPTAILVGFFATGKAVTREPADAE